MNGFARGDNRTRTAALRRRTRGTANRPSGKAARGSHGFTLVEVMVAIILLGVGVVAVFGGMRSLAAAQTKAQTADLLQRLALDEFDQLGGVIDPTTAPSSGDFSDEGYPNITWILDVEPSSVTNLDQVTVKADLNANGHTEEQAITGMLYVPATTGTTSTAGGATGGAGAGE